MPAWKICTPLLAPRKKPQTLPNTDSAQIKKQLKTSQLFHFLFAVVIAILVMVVVYRLGALAINRYVSQPYIIESPATVITGPLPTDTP